jgi:hypothetical protein
MMQRPTRTRDLIFVAVLMTMIGSCGAKKTPERVVVHLQDPYSGPLHLTPCVAGAQDPMVVRPGGTADIADCPIGDVEVEVVGPAGPLYFPADQVQLVKAGDGVPAQITVVLP